MKRLFFFFLIISICAEAWSQNVYWGYPRKEQMALNDMIVIPPLPWTLNAAFDSSIVSYTEQMKNFMLVHNEFKFVVKINRWASGDSLMNQKITELQAKRWMDLISYDTVFVNSVELNLLPVGASNQLISRSCLNLESEYYQVLNNLNNRVEILLCKKEN